MNLSQRQIVIKNHVCSVTKLLPDLCNIVAQYVFPNAFQMKLKTITKVKDGEWFQLPLFILNKVNLNTGRICTVDDSTINGEKWFSDDSFVYCGETPLFKIGCPSKWISFNHELNEAYFISNKGFIYTINEEGKEPIPACPVPKDMKYSLFQDPWQMVMTKNRKVIFWTSASGHGSRSVPILVSMDLTGRLLQTDRGFMIEPGRVSSKQSIINEENLFIFSGETENEIWSFNIHGRATIYSETSLQYLRKEKTTIHRFNLLQHQQTLYKVEKHDSLEISVFE